MDLSRNLKAAAVLAVHAVMLVLAFPGLDVASEDTLEREDVQDALDAYVPAPLVPVVKAVVNLNAAVRIPITERFTPIERVFRIRQNWSVYRSGPAKVGRLEVWVDGELQYRSADPEHAWRAAWFSNRHLRPPVEGVVMKRHKGKNTPAIRRLIATFAWRDFPDAQEVEVVGTLSAYPGTKRKVVYDVMLDRAEAVP
jgi:hypothetical protein